MKCAECRIEMLDTPTNFVIGKGRQMKLYFCSLKCKKDYLRRVLGDMGIKELNFEHNN